MCARHVCVTGVSYVKPAHASITYVHYKHVLEVRITSGQDRPAGQACGTCIWYICTVHPRVEGMSYCFS